MCMRVFSATVGIFLVLMLNCIRVRAAQPVPSDPHPRLERGWRVPGTGFTLGGYATENFTKKKDAPWAFTTEDLNLFLGWEGAGKLKFFSELSLDDALIFKQPGKFVTGNRSLHFERAYFDYTQSERVNFRLGRFLTPVGHWNLIHADPLVWTTTRPLITQRTFPTYATGAMIYGTQTTLGKDTDYSLYAAQGKEIHTNATLYPYDATCGLHVATAISKSSQLGYSYANLTQAGAIEDRQNLFGIDYLWSLARYEFSGEAIYRYSSLGHLEDERGLFVQAVTPLSERLYGVGRYEFFHQAGPQPGVNLWIAGLAFRTTPTSVLKTEYVHAVNNEIKTPEGFWSSISILF